MMTTQYSPGHVAQRLVVRTARYVLHDRLILFGLLGLLALALLGGGGLLAGWRVPSAAPEQQAAEQYIRAMQQRDVSALLGSLSPDMLRTMERRTGQSGTAAISALFAEQERLGQRIVSYQLVSRYETVQGDRLYFYVVRSQAGSEQRDVPYLISVGADGKVNNVD